MAKSVKWGLIVLAIFLLAGAVLQLSHLLGEEEKPAVLVLLPQSNSLEGWNVVEDSLQYCPTPDSLADIYDGGYEYYVEAGVQQAAVQAYACEDDLILVYVHEMASPEQAKGIFEESTEKPEDDTGSSNALEIKDGCLLYVGGGQSSGYLWRNRFYCNVVAASQKDALQSAVKGFLGLLSDGIGAHVGEEEDIEQ